MQEKVAPSADTGSGNDIKPPLARTLIKAILKDELHAVRIVAVDRRHGIKQGQGCGQGEIVGAEMVVGDE